jgi:hypothetical protein
LPRITFFPKPHLRVRGSGGMVRKPGIHDEVPQESPQILCNISGVFPLKVGVNRSNPMVWRLVLLKPRERSIDRL